MCTRNVILSAFFYSYVVLAVSESDGRFLQVKATSDIDDLVYLPAVAAKSFYHCAIICYKRMSECKGYRHLSSNRSCHLVSHVNTSNMEVGVSPDRLFIKRSLMKCHTTGNGGNCFNQTVAAVQRRQRVQTAFSPGCDLTETCKTTVGYPSNIKPLCRADNSVFDKVKCEFDDSGGWIVIQKRVDGTINFQRNWKDYKIGFGDIHKEFWIGLELIHQLTNASNTTTLQVILETWDNEVRNATYNNFYVSGEKTNYTLEVGGYSGNIGDSLTYHNGMQFSTQDRDNDAYGGNCASIRNGGWWYKSCIKSNLNGLYIIDGTNGNTVGAIWTHWKGWYYAYKTITMRVKFD